MKKLETTGFLETETDTIISSTGFAARMSGKISKAIVNRLFDRRFEYLNDVLHDNMRALETRIAGKTAEPIIAYFTGTAELKKGFEDGFKAFTYKSGKSFTYWDSELLSFVEHLCKSVTRSSPTRGIIHADDMPILVLHAVGFDAYVAPLADPIPAPDLAETLKRWRGE